LLETLEAHCRKTGRPELACELIEEAVRSGTLPAASAVDCRRRLIDVYLAADAPHQALHHVETLLQLDPADNRVRDAAKRMLVMREVADRVSALLQDVRQRTRRT
jgi:hypothetical protein